MQRSTFDHLHRARRARRSALVGFTAAIAIGSLVACATPASEPSGPRSVTFGTYGLPGTWDWLGTTNMGVELYAQAVYEPLIMEDATNNEFLPWLAEEFSLSDDGRTVSMRLREDVDFIDGTHLNAEAVKASLDVMYADEAWDQRSVMIDEYGTSVSVTGEYGLEFTTQNPIRRTWFDSVGLTPVISPDAFADREALLSNPVGTGPYLVDESVPDVSVSYVRNPDYWNPEAYPYDTVELIQLADPVANLNALKSGQVDAGAILPTQAADAEAAGLELFTAPFKFVGIFVMDRAGAVVPALADVRVRQAMSLAFDREGINTAINLGYGDISSQAFVEGQTAYVEGGDDRYDYDPERARELLAEAGYPDGFDLVIPTVSGLPIIAEYEPIMQQALGDIGIRVTYEVAPDAGTMIGNWMSGQFPVAVWQIPHSETYSIGWIDKFFGGFTPEGQELFDRVRQSAPAESLVAQQELGEFLLDEAWWIVISSPQAIYAADPSVDIRLGGFFALPKLWEYTPAE